MDRQKLVIVGAGGHGAEVSAYVQDILARGWDGELLGFLDDAPSANSTKVLGPLDRFVNCPPDFFRNLFYVTAVGNNPSRRNVVNRLHSLYGARLTSWTLIHPTSHVGPEVVIGEGSCLAPGSIATTRARIGKHCILNIKASISHDCIIGDFVNLNPGATICGNVDVGEEAYIGAGATVKERISIGAGSVIGAGAVVVRDVPPRVTVVGVPARIIKHE